MNNLKSLISSEIVFIETWATNQQNILMKQFYSFRGPTNDQMGFYDYSFNNNYLLFQNPTAGYNNSEYFPTNAPNYHEFNSLPSYNHFPSATSPIFNSSYRHASASNLTENSKFVTQSKAESEQVSNSDSISLEKLQSIIHNTSEHVHELNQMCQIKEPKDFDKNLSSELLELIHQLLIKLDSIRRLKSPRHVVVIMRKVGKAENKKETANSVLPVASRGAWAEV